MTIQAPAQSQPLPDEAFQGYAIHDTAKWDEFTVTSAKPKPIGPHDVDIKIHFCGVCASDIHTITGGWGKPRLPVIPGHEIVGVVAHVGPEVTTAKVGDRVGVGAQVSACLECHKCKNGNEQHCSKCVYTYNSVYPDGTVSQGGYATAIRVHEHFAFPIPDSMKLEEAACFFCAGLTVFSPLKRYGAGPGKRVGLVGLGGLGHFTLQFARALGCEEVVAFSHSSRKKEDAMKLGATKFVETSQEGFEKPLKGTLDLIICTANVSAGLPLNELCTTLDVGGKMIIVALPDDALPPIKAATLAVGGILIGGSSLGSRAECLEMLEVAAKHNVKPWIEILPMKDASKAVNNLHNGQVRYRQVLKQDIDPVN
ncbi:hypothetical protein CVT24_006926 [Panaeolus cyanescens]|uniref:alcohol dehydrogenase (NADP(+)) n=1 Tax=Panaeolus cyanescens TaxID=181874 RepID=A0A409VK36_9AGAR|nr:hypothetical protein CVT24_006926 [Panaeolus cyanescens]